MAGRQPAGRRWCAARPQLSASPPPPPPPPHPRSAAASAAPTARRRRRARVAGFDPLGLGKPTEYLQFDLDALDQNAAQNKAGKLLGTIKVKDNTPTEDTLVVRDAALRRRRRAASAGAEEGETVPMA